MNRHHIAFVEDGVVQNQFPVLTSHTYDRDCLQSMQCPWCNTTFKHREEKGPGLLKKFLKKSKIYWDAASECPVCGVDPLWDDQQIYDHVSKREGWDKEQWWAVCLAPDYDQSIDNAWKDDVFKVWEISPFVVMHTDPALLTREVLGALVGEFSDQMSSDQGADFMDEFTDYLEEKGYVCPNIPMSMLGIPLADDDEDDEDENGLGHEVDDDDD